MPRDFEGSQTCVVEAGDSLSAIAARYNVPLDVLIAANSGLVRDPDVIQVGWKLVIPGKLRGEPAEAPAGTDVEEHIVSPGDTLSALARSWGTSVAAIAELNGIVNPALIAVGQRIRRPDVAEAEAASVDRANGTRLRFSRYPLDLPPAVITGGYREDYGGYLHRGIDIGGVPVGTPIKAPAAGKVTTHRPGDGWGSGSFGNCVILDHVGTPWWTIYGHMDEIRCSNGDTVAAGDTIGTVGFTGKVVPPGPAGAHLHWQLSDHGSFPPNFEYVANPLDFLDR
ncbi:MAG: M23 family metallopeptidase [Dehalococcoidia bacterium]|nr:M23 family metallopeptidase [Dehalococcoidia bacterium]